MDTFSIRTQTFRLGLADYRAAWLSPRINAPAFIGSLGPFIAVPLALGWSDLRRGHTLTCLLAAAIYLGISLAASAIQLSVLWSRYRRTAMMTGERLMILDRDAVRLIGPGFDISQAWSRFFRLYQGRRHLFLLMRNYQAYVIPKKALDGDDAARLYVCARAAMRKDRPAQKTLPMLTETLDNREIWLARPYFREGRTFSFTRDYVRYTTPTFDGRYDWNNVRRVSRAFGFFIFRLANGRLIVPASAFATKAQATAFHTQAVAFWRAAEARREFRP